MPVQFSHPDPTPAPDRRPCPGTGCGGTMERTISRREGVSRWRCAGCGFAQLAPLTGSGQPYHPTVTE